MFKTVKSYTWFMAIVIAYNAIWFVVDLIRGQYVWAIVFFALMVLNIGLGVVTRDAMLKRERLEKELSDTRGSRL